jgi:lipid-A-disaccharide synthase-like uncharacterized protein
MHAKMFKFSILGSHGSLLYLLRYKDEVKQLELVLLTRFSPLSHLPMHATFWPIFLVPPLL